MAGEQTMDPGANDTAGVEPAPGPAPTSTQTTTPAPVADPTAVVVGRGGEIPPEKISERIERERRKFLRDEYGTDDPARIEEIRATREQERAEYESLREEARERRRQQMSDQERLAADLEEERTRRVALEEQIAHHEQERQVTEQARSLDQMASALVAPEYREFLLHRFARHVDGLSERDAMRLTPAAINRWMREWVTANPQYGLKPPAPAPVAPEPRKVPLTTSAVPRGGRPSPTPAPAHGGAAGKTVAPGKANSMTRAELAAYMRSRGLNPY